MLVRIAGEDDPAIVLFDECEQLQHLFAADLPGLIHEDDCAMRHGTSRDKRTDRLRASEAVAFQIGDLLALRREDLNRVTCRFESGFDFAQRETFTRASTAAKKRHKII